MRQHSGAKAGLLDCLFARLLLGVTAPIDLEPVFGELLVLVGQPARGRGVVGQEEDNQDGANGSDQAFDDE